MKLFKLLKNINCRIFGLASIEIEGLYHNDKDVRENGLFFCINGKNFSGENFVINAIKNGAVAIVTESEITNIHGVTQILVKNVRKAMSLIACNFYGNPAEKLKIIAVTGTNGKTTTTHMIAGLMQNLGRNCAIIGTNGAIYNNKKIETEMTTPDPIVLQKILYKMERLGVEYVCMETSAHAIYLNKLDGIKFELVIFTNLTEDHLDYFLTMENYFQAKRKIFSKYFTKRALINIDDEYGKRIYDSINVPKYTYSINSSSNFKSDNLKLENFQQTFLFNGKFLKTNFLGEFNVYNLTSALASLEILGFKVKDSQSIINKLNPVEGRFNTIVIKNKLFIIDYAHTPDGLENVLKLSKRIAGYENLICVFGCGGNRETQKRSKMGEISSKYANSTIITSDNPRFEDRLKIAKDIEKGMTNSNYLTILDRSEAIKFAFKNSKENDVILIAGKGAENYIDEMGEKKPYSDFDEVRKLEN